jgi:hypothetical protein
MTTVCHFSSLQGQSRADETDLVVIDEPYEDAAESIEFLEVPAYVKHLSTSLYNFVLDFETLQL